MSSGAFTEWLPAFGVSWQTVQVPENEAGTVTPLENVTPLSPPTPLMVNARVLKSASPRAIDCRAAQYGSRRDRGRSFHASNNVKTFGLNAAPVGLSPTGSLMPV